MGRCWLELELNDSWAEGCGIYPSVASRSIRCGRPKPPRHAPRTCSKVVRVVVQVLFPHFLVFSPRALPSLTSGFASILSIGENRGIHGPFGVMTCRSIQKQQVQNVLSLYVHPRVRTVAQFLRTLCLRLSLYKTPSRWNERRTQSF